MVEVAVGQQDRHRVEAVLAQGLGKWFLGVLAWVDDDTGFTLGGGEQEAVGLERSRGEPDHEHVNLLGDCDWTSQH
jgi:hypothetical protein